MTFIFPKASTFGLTIYMRDISQPIRNLSINKKENIVIVKNKIDQWQ